MFAAPTPPQRTFRLWVQVIRWIDGDTFTGVIDQGFNHYIGRLDKPVSCRCAHINAPEMKTGDPGLDSLMFARTIVPLGWYECVSYKPDEYGRPLLDLVLPAGGTFSEVMIASGHASVYR